MVGHTGVFRRRGGDRGRRDAWPVVRPSTRAGAPASSRPTTATPTTCSSPTARRTRHTRPTRCPSSSPRRPQLARRRDPRGRGSHGARPPRDRAAGGDDGPLAADARRCGLTSRGFGSTSSPATGKRGRGASRPAMASWTPRRSSRLPPRARSAGSTPTRSPALVTGWSSATRSTSSCAPGRSASPSSGVSTPSCNGTGRSSPTRAASRCSRSPTVTWPTRSRVAAERAARPRGDHRDRRGGGPVSLVSRRHRAVHGAGGVHAGPGGARLRSRPRVRRVHALPRRLDYTARSTERTHRWLDRCTRWHEANAPAGQALFGIVQGGVHGELRRASAERVGAAPVDGISIGGTLGRDKQEMRGVLNLTVPLLAVDAPKAPARARRARRPPGRDRARHRPVRLRGSDQGFGRHGTALAPLPGRRFRLDVRSRALERERRGRWWPVARVPPAPGIRAPTCTIWRAPRSSLRRGCSPFTTSPIWSSLVRGARAAIAASGYAAYREASLGGAAPWEAWTGPDNLLYKGLDFSPGPA